MAEADLYTIVKVARNEDLMEQIGRDRYFDLVDHNKVRSFRIKRWTPFNLFKEEVAKEFGIPVQFQRFWLWAKRKNHTYRPDRHVTPQQEAQPVGCLRAPKANDAELNLFLEVERSRWGLLKIPPPLFSDDILLFFKLYDPLKEELRYVGQFYVNADRMPVHILAKINRLAGFAPGEDIELFEEIKSEPNVMCERVDKMVTFRHSELGNGDIICFQISPADESSGQCGHPNVPSFLEYVHDHQAAEHVPSEPTHFVNASNRDSNYATPPAGKVRFLSYWVSSKASLLLGKIHCLHKETFVKFSVASRFMQTGVLESFALFVESMLTAKVNEVNEEVLRQAFLSVKEFEQVGLDLLWLKRRLEEAELVNKLSDSRIFVESCETSLKCARAKVRELEEVLAKAKEEVELASRESPESLGVNDLVLEGVM